MSKQDLLEFKGKVIVVKYGGAAMIEESLRKSFTRDIALMKLVGMNPVIVHGGGPQIGKELSKAGLESEFIEGLRVTTKPVMNIVKKWWVIPEINFVSQFYDEKLFLDAFAENGKKYNIKDYDEIIFSFHGLPERHVDKVYDDSLCKDNNCEKGITKENQFCYKATCYETAKQIAKRLNLKKSDYIVAFQSRLDNKWLKPFSDDIIKKRAEKGDKKILCFSPSFVADCLETIIEIGDEYQEIFEEYGGEKVQLVESLNDSKLWVKCLEKIVRDRTIEN